MQSFSLRTKIKAIIIDKALTMSHHCHQNTSVKLTRKLKIVMGGFLFVVAVSFLPVNWLMPLNHSLMMYIGAIWWAILLGLFIGGIIEHYVPKDFISKAMGKDANLPIFKAAGAGLFMAACSHGILAIAIQLHKKGASSAATVTFLLASPWANLPVTILLFGFFGIKGLYFIFAALLVAIITGYIFSLFENRGIIESNELAEEGESQSHLKSKNSSFRGVVKSIYQGTIQLSNMVLWWILIGILIAGFIGAYVPQDIFTEILSASFLGLLTTLGVATIIEVCSEGSAPLAFEIYNQTSALGNPFVFLMAGVVTDYTEIGLIWSNIGRRTAILLPLVTVPQVLAFGYLFNFL